VKWAVDVYNHDKEGFAQLQENSMQKRFDWSEAAKGYEEIYEKIIAGRSNT
jgi:glycogen synthase